MNRVLNRQSSRHNERACVEVELVTTSKPFGLSYTTSKKKTFSDVVFSMHRGTSEVPNML